MGTGTGKTEDFAIVDCVRKNKTNTNEILFIL